MVTRGRHLTHKTLQLSQQNLQTWPRDPRGRAVLLLLPLSFLVGRGQGAGLLTGSGLPICSHSLQP